MPKAASQEIGRFSGNDPGPYVAIEGASLDIPAATSMQNVLFFLSLAFRYPREAVYAELGRLLPVFEDFYDAYAGNIPELPEMEELQAAYIRLFVNNRGRVPAVPYASCYLDRGILMGESYHRLCQDMQKTGFVLDESAGELEDHLAIVLEYASVLTGRLIEASASGDSPSDEIIRSLGEVTFRYLRPMMGPISSGISGTAANGFYDISARALFNFTADAEAVFTQIFGVPVSAALTTGVTK